MGTQGICILLVNEDLICCNLVAEILKGCTYEVLHVGKPLETLLTICERKDAISLVLTNLHRIQAQGTNDILHHIQKKLDLPIFLMSPDDEKIDLQGQDNSFAAYLLNSLNHINLSSLWELASIKAMEVTKPTDTEASGSAQMALSSRNVLMLENTPSSHGNQSSREHQERRKKRERRERRQEGEASSGDDRQYLEKKPRVIWTDDLHKKFLEAMEIIRPDKPVPKKIVEIMNVPWLKRENVASHLQKYRLVLKKAEERANASKNEMILRNSVGQLRIPSYPSKSGMAHFQRSPLGLKSIAGPSNHPPSMNARAPSSILNFRRSSLLPSNNQGSIQQLYNPNLASSNQPQMSQKNNYLPLAVNSRGNDRTGLQQRQLNLGPRNQVMNSGFRVYGDQKRSMLLRDPGSKSMGDSNMAESSVKSFMGFRLTNGGKSLEFGQPSASVSNENRREFSSFKFSGSENQSLNHLLPSASANKTQVPPSTYMQQNVSTQNHNSEIDDPFLDCMSLLMKSFEVSVPADPPTAIQHRSLKQELGTTVNEAAFRGASGLVNDILPPQQQALLPQFEFGIPASWNLSVQSAPLPTSGEQQTSSLPSGPSRNDHFVQYHAALLNGVNGIFDDLLQNPVPTPSQNNIVGHSPAMLAAQQVTNIPSVEITGRDGSIQEPLASFQNVLNQESSAPSVPEHLNNSLLDENISSFLNETASPPGLWDGSFDDTFFN